MTHIGLFDRPYFEFNILSSWGMDGWTSCRCISFNYNLNKVAFQNARRGRVHLSFPNPKGNDSVTKYTQVMQRDAQTRNDPGI